MPNLNRRDFLKALGVSTGASALSACGLDDNRVLTPVERILPYVVRDEQTIPGTPTFFATTITRGPYARAVTARHRDGRVVFVSHNPMAPGRPAVGKAPLFELQKAYSPDRLKGPTDGGQPTTWDAGLAKLADAVRSAVAAGKKVAYVGGYRSGAIVDLIADLTQGNAVYFEPLGLAHDVTAAERLFGVRAAPFYGFDKAQYVLSFGAPFLSDAWGDSEAEERYAQARDPNRGGFVARFALVAPKRDQTGANADDFFVCTPGSEVAVARAVARIVAEKKGADATVLALIGDASAAAAASASGLSEAQIQSIAENFLSLNGLAVPGGPSGSTDLSAAVYLLNLAVGAAPERFHLGGFQGPVSGYEALDALKASLDAGQVGVLLLDDVNLVYALPADSGMAASIAKADLVVGLASAPDETQALASLVLPTSNTFEDWGDESPVAGMHLLRQPTMTALYDTRSLGDVLLATGRAALPAPFEPVTLAYLPDTWRAYVSAWWQKNVWDQQGTFEAFWDAARVSGFVAKPVQAAAPVLVATSYAFGSAPVATGTTLIAFAHSHLHDGRYANEPWGQELSDPLTGNTWDSWLEVHPETAKAWGVGFNDLVEVTTAAGTVEVAVYAFPGIHKDVVALAFGQGHTAIGRYGNGKGVNAASLFSSTKDAQGQHTFAGTSVQVKPLGRKGDLATTFSLQGMSDEGRHFGVHVDAAKLAATGDAPSAHPGELTAIHHLGLDERLQNSGVEGFYGTPDHSTYRFGMSVDTNACNGCGACSLACYAENNLPVVGKEQIKGGREMSWIRVNRYWEADVGGVDDVRFVPMMCQHCGHAGCENVCPVLATYHNIDGLNAMVYNRCVGTRYCSNACPYSVRRFNFHSFTWPEPFHLQLNPDVSTRQMGIMEKCTFCVQRIRATKIAAKREGDFQATVADEAWQNIPACVEACPSRALTFGNLKDAEGAVSKADRSPRRYKPIEELRSLSAVTYLAKASFHDDPTAHHGGGHAAAHGDAAPETHHEAGPAAGDEAGHAAGEAH